MALVDFILRLHSIPPYELRRISKAPPRYMGNLTRVPRYVLPTA